MRRLLIVLAVPLIAAQLSCAATGFTPDARSMPAARAALRPEHQIFYDALLDYGDWILVEPYGHLFRPKVDLNAWRPYRDGFWVPTDSFGWVWASAEPFGWATYHYGTWINDSYEGWLWRPGSEWAPAWVDWRASDGYVGWAPLQPNGAAPTSASAYNFVRVSDLGTPDLASRVVSGSQVSAEARAAQPVENYAESDGVVFNRGPSLQWVERRAGLLQPATIRDLVTAPPIAAPLPDSDANARPSADSVAVMKRAADQAARETRQGARSVVLPNRVTLVRPLGVPRPLDLEESAAKDSLRAPKNPRRRPMEGTASPDSAR